MKIKNIVSSYLQVAIKKRASDLFLTPAPNGWLIKLRVVDHCEILTQLSPPTAAAIINYFKFAAQMDIAEHRRPQVGSFTYHAEKQDYYLRLSSVGNFADKESLVIRIIYGLASSQYYFPNQLQKLLTLSQKRGLIITSGPTGSGKTTTMYELAAQLASDKVVMTIEDPVEIYLPQFLQTQVNLEARISYQELLKAALRQRPDILIIGEIRDAETAKLAIAAALSGHLVLATVHAKSSLQTVSRLLGLGVSQSELYNCLTAVSYQRLIPNAQGQLACLLDIASNEILQEKLTNSTFHDFVDWHDNLRVLKENGTINHETYTNYFQG